MHQVYILSSPHRELREASNQDIMFDRNLHDILESSLHCVEVVKNRHAMLFFNYRKFLLRLNVG